MWVTCCNNRYVTPLLSLVLGLTSFVAVVSPSDCWAYIQHGSQRCVSTLISGSCSLALAAPDDEHHRKYQLFFREHKCSPFDDLEGKEGNKQK